MKTQLWPCTPSPAICGWYLPGLPPSCLGSAGDLTRRSVGGMGWCWLSLALLQPFLAPYREQFQWQLNRDGGGKGTYNRMTEC